MLKKWLDTHLSKPREAEPPPPGEPLPNPRLSRTVTFGPARDDTGEVLFLDDIRGICRTIIDKDGQILRFPGILREDSWIRCVETENFLLPQIRFRTTFTQEADGRFLMIWEAQPDGRYWADEDGFGIEHDVEIHLYTHIDRNGDFTGPFRIYSLGTKTFYQG